MNKQIFNYALYPSVVHADIESTVVIHPLGENTRFLPGITYTVEVRPVETFSHTYAKQPVVWYNLKPNEDGNLILRHHFAGEQRHSIKLIRPQEDIDATPYRDITHRGKFHENTEALLYVYSLNDDLYGLRCYKGEVHCHTYESDGVQDVCHTVGNYRSAGYDFLAITDHYITMSAEKAKRIFANAPITLLLGEECHVPTENIHTIRIGGFDSVNAYYRDHTEAATAEMESILQTLDYLPEDVDKTDYAWRVWIARKAREFGGLPVLTHPHWLCWYDVYFMASSITKQLLKDGVYDALDITDQEYNTSIALWVDMQTTLGHPIPVVGCTDSHYTNADDPERPAGNLGGYTLVFARDRSEDSLLSAIRNGNSVAVTTVGEPERIYGPYRLVKFAQFLLENYYPLYRRLCHGQGVLLSEYPVDGTANQEVEFLLDKLTDRSETFAQNFYGY